MCVCARGKYLFVIPLCERVCVCEREENEALLSPREHFRLLRVLLHRLRLHPPASVCSIQDFSHLSTQPASARPREGCLLPSGAFSVAAAVYNSHLSLSLSLSLSPVGQVEVFPPSVFNEIQRKEPADRVGKKHKNKRKRNENKKGEKVVLYSCQSISYSFSSSSSLSL